MIHFKEHVTDHGYKTKKGLTPEEKKEYDRYCENWLKERITTIENMDENIRCKEIICVLGEYKPSYEISKETITKVLTAVRGNIYIIGNAEEWSNNEYLRSVMNTLGIYK